MADSDLEQIGRIACAIDAAAWCSHCSPAIVDGRLVWSAWAENVLGREFEESKEHASQLDAWLDLGTLVLEQLGAGHPDAPRLQAALLPSTNGSPELHPELFLLCIALALVALALVVLAGCGEGLEAQACADDPKCPAPEWVEQLEGGEGEGG